MTAYGAPPAQPPAGPKSQLPLFDLIGAGAGVLVFIMGFLPWYGTSGSSVPGFGVGSAGSAVIVMSLFAGLVAGAKMLDPKAEPGFVPMAGAVAALLVTFGLMIDKGDGGQGLSIKIGLILTLILTLVQAGVFVYTWLQASGKISAGGGSAAPAAWGAPQQQQFGQPTYNQPSAPGQPSHPGQPSQYGGSPSYGSQPSAPSGGGYQPGQSGGQSGYGQTTQHGYSQPGQSSTPSSTPGSTPGSSSGGYGQTSYGGGSTPSTPSTPPSGGYGQQPPSTGQSGNYGQPS